MTVFPFVLFAVWMPEIDHFKRLKDGQMRMCLETEPTSAPALVLQSSPLRVYLKLMQPFIGVVLTIGLLKHETPKST